MYEKFLWPGGHVPSLRLGKLKTACLKLFRFMVCEMGGVCGFASFSYTGHVNNGSKVMCLKCNLWKNE